MTITSEIITPLHRLGALLRYLDIQPSYGTHVLSGEVRRLLVGDLDKPMYAALRADRADWLERVHRAAEVVAWRADDDASVGGLRQVLNERPDGDA